MPCLYRLPRPLRASTNIFEFLSALLREKIDPSFRPRASRARAALALASECLGLRLASLPPLRVALAACSTRPSAPVPHPSYITPAAMPKPIIVPPRSGRAVRTSTKTNATTLVKTAVQVELKGTGDVLMAFCRTDGIGGLFQAKHRLVVNPNVAKRLTESRRPLEWEATFVVERLNEQLGRQAPEEVDRPLIQQFLNSAIDSLNATASAPAASKAAAVPTTAASATSSPPHRRAPASAVAFIDLGVRGKLYARSTDWKWTHESWHAAIHCNYPTWGAVPTEEEFGRVRVLLLQLLARGPLAREAAREVLHLALLRAQLLDPPALRLNEVLSAPPKRFWFTVDCGMPPPALKALLDASLLENQQWLEANELHAFAARALLGATVAEVVETLTASAEIPVSASVRRMLQHDRKPLPSARAAQLVVLAGGPPAMRFLSSVIATAGVSQVMRHIDLDTALEGVVMNTSASEYWILNTSHDMVSLVVPDVHLRCNSARRECAHGLGKPEYCAPRYIPTVGATTAATDATDATPNGRRAQQRSAPSTSASIGGATPPTSMAAANTPDWRQGTYFGVVMRDLMLRLHDAHEEGVLSQILVAACTMTVVARNAYNTDYIECELGDDCEIYLNAHGTRMSDGKNHYWLEKISRLSRPFAADYTKVVLAVSDALPISQSWKTLVSSKVDTGEAVAKLYAAACVDDEPGRTGNPVLWLLNLLAVPDMYVQRSLRRDVTTIMFGAGKNWNQSFERLVMTREVSVHTTCV